MTRRTRDLLRWGALVVLGCATALAFVATATAEHPWSSPAPVFVPVFGGLVVAAIWKFTGSSHLDWEFRGAPRASGELVEIAATDVSEAGSAAADLTIDVVTPEATFRAVTRTRINLGDMPRFVPGVAVEVAYLADRRVRFIRLLVPAR
ncbi:hypothetical protein FB468_3006 [Leucobacter komagatae]|uniref:Uncharacterized protein n=1 Tax=Leucobacter komagatae TaxID=55969 RepID=A0A542XXC8_9MICO|nr:hypothetical protein [Leucobacter komagatae]TQL40485.1 hypothetical protein FB468_3006 [Leucobacter komagatae]